MFSIVARLFGIDIAPLEHDDTWHEDVRLFQVRDESGHLRGLFYLDLYARASKRGGAWMDDCIGRRRVNGDVQYPVAYLTCNFSPPVSGKAATVTHDEVITLFHEFGHGLHHLLTLVDESAVAGINGVPWDGVELPSQFLENWCWESEALELISADIETGEPIPQAMVERLLAAKNFHAAMMLLRQLEFALFDFRLHREYCAGCEPQQLLDQIRSEIAVVIPPASNRFQNSFSHIFAGGYAAGYYSYLWAEVLSADAYSRFSEQGVFDPTAGREFLGFILERGGADDLLAAFRRFRGRDPDPSALLRQAGLEN